MQKNKIQFFKRSWPFLVLLIGVLIFFKDIFFLKKYFWEDIFYLAYPSLTYLANSLKCGYIPFWTPYVFCGMPFMVNIEAQVFYPINWILPVFVKDGMLPFVVVEIQVIFHILLGGFFSYLYTREIGLSKLGALISAFTFMISGFLITQSIHLFIINTFIWLPLILFFLHKAFRTKKYIYGLLGGLFFGISILGGSPQFTLHMSYFILIYILFYVLSGIKKREYKKDYLFIGFTLLLVGYGIASIQYLPTYEYLKYTLRESMSYKDSVENSLAPSQLITLFIPKFFGSRTGMGTDSVPFWGGEARYATFWDTCIYIGIFPLIFAFFAFRKKREKLVWFFGGVAILSLIAAMGKNTPFYKFVYYVIPGFNKFRCPGRFSGLFSLSIAILAGFGGDSIFGNKKYKFPKSLIIFMGVVLLFWILFYGDVFRSIINKYARNPESYTNILKQYNIFIFFLLSSLVIIFLQVKSVVHRDILKILSIIFIFADLYIFGHRFNASNRDPDKIYTSLLPLVKFLKEKREQEFFRVNARKDGYMLLPRNSGNVYRIELIEGYTPLILQRRWNFFKLPFEKALALLNVKYRIAIDKKTGKMGLQENTNYLPRAFLVSDYVLADNEEEVLEILSDKNFNYREKIVLEEVPEIDLSWNNEEEEYYSYIEIDRENTNPNRISINVSTNMPNSFLVLSEVYYPGWKAYVNGKRTKIYCADYLLRAICISKGESKVEFVYDSTTFKIGLTISLLTILFVLTCIIFPNLKQLLKPNPHK